MANISWIAEVDSLEEEMIILSSTLGISVVSDVTGVWIEIRKTAAIEIRNNVFDLNQFFNIGNSQFKFQFLVKAILADNFNDESKKVDMILILFMLFRKSKNDFWVSSMLD